VSLPYWLTVTGSSDSGPKGVEVVELTDLADQVRTINARILRRDGGSVS